MLVKDELRKIEDSKIVRPANHFLYNPPLRARPHYRVTGYTFIGLVSLRVLSSVSPSVCRYVPPCAAVTVFAEIRG